ncbi:zinc-binding alcohol dehydrogenase family protein [Acidobacterium sp. S8]|uniref:quinone oxidoreductase family protein n=1 Tax=Acidobacterium sp. S8 TaxID=1641854 RepID=UPI00131A88D7|nr:zinc-binding alcohol dehydrogenase family protein [Acidobacterium sp. S8]
MKAAIVTSAGMKPTFGEFDSPVPREGFEVITVTAAALTNLTKGRAAGSHYSADNHYPFVPGVDGVGTLADGRRVYFAIPEAPFGAMAEQTLVDPRRTITLPNNLDDVNAAALANPGMSCFAALVERARFKAGEIVLINGATGAAGFVAVQVAKALGAAKVIVTGRNAPELEALRSVGADVVIPFDLRPENERGVEDFEEALLSVFADGLDVVVDYLWGSSARTIIVAVAKAVEDAHPVRFVQVGEASREPVEVPAAALRSSAIQILGSGLKSVPMPKLLEGIRQTFDLAAQGKLYLPTKVVPLETVAENWEAPGKPRLVFTLRESL